MEDYGDWVWDESEYNFFMSLTDADKLEYVFDFFNYDFDNDTFDDVVEFELDNLEPSAESVDVDVIITDTHLIIQCAKKQVIDRTINMFVMDGFILSHQDSRGNCRTYKLIGTVNPISLN